MARAGRTLEQELAIAAGAAHGLVTRRALLRAGFAASAIDHRLRKGTLLPEYRGVYRVGHRAPSTESRYLAAVLACGDGAVLIGPAAAYMFGLIRGTEPLPRVACPTERRIPGVVTRRSRSLDGPDVTAVRGIPSTTVARTLVDLAAMLDAASLARACHEAMVRCRVTPGHVEAVLWRHPRSEGAVTLRRVLRGDEAVTMSELERRFLLVLEAAGLPGPQTNRIASGRYVDCRWPAYRLTVELDGYRFHSTRHAWELDRRREREARARGDEFRRYTYGDVVEAPRLMLVELRELLGLRQTSATACAGTQPAGNAPAGTSPA